MSELCDLSIVVPSYNARELLARTLRTVRHEAPEAEVLVVDGSSSDGSGAMVRAEFPTVTLITLPNHGFAHAINRGLERARGTYFLLLNSDLFVTRPALLAMLGRLSAEPRLGAVSPRLVNEDGSVQEVFGPFYWPNWVEIRRPTRVWVLPAACLMTRRDVIDRVGALDETFFLYNEEYDWCARCRAEGYHLEMLPERVVHVGGGSTPRSPALTLEAQRGFLYLASKHAPGFVSESLRRAMLIEGFCYARLDPRPEHRAMWSKLESLTRRAAYEESPFPLSGRGASVARPNGLRWSEGPPRAERLAGESGARLPPKVGTATVVSDPVSRPRRIGGSLRASSSSSDLTWKMAQTTIALPMRRDPAARRQRLRRAAI